MSEQPTEPERCDYSELPVTQCACTHCDPDFDASLRDPAVDVWGGVFGG